MPAAAALVLLAALLPSSTAHGAARDRIMPHGSSAAAEVESMIAKEEAAIEALDRTPPQYFQAKRRLDEAMQLGRYASHDAYSGHPEATRLLDDVLRLDLAAKAYDRYLDPNLWSKAQVDKAVAKFRADIEKALALKKKALAILEHSAAASTPCVVSYPVAAAGESTIGLSGCKVALTAVGITFPSTVKSVTNWAVESSTGMNTGACTKSGDALECKLNNPMPLTSIFVEGFGPALKIGEKMVFNLTPKTGKDIVFTVIAPAGPKLAVSGTMTANTTGGAVPGTSFTVNLKVAGGPFQNFFFDMTYTGLNPGNSGPTAVTTSLSCGTQASPLGANHNRWICNSFKVLSDPPGSYSFVANFQNPVPSGTVLKGHITGTGVGAPAEFELKTP